MNSLGKNAGFSLLYRMGTVIFPLISGMYLARVLSPGDLGRVASVRNTVSYFLMLSALGIPQYALREVARCRDNKRDLEKLVSELVLLHLAAATVSLAAFWGIFCLGQGSLLHRICALELVFQLCNLEWLFEGREEYRFIALRSLAVRILSFLALILLVRGPADVPVYAAILCLATGGNQLLNLCRSQVTLRFRNLQIRRHLTPILTLALSGLAASLYSKVDITMLGLLSSDDAVGWYTTAWKIIGLVLTLTTAITAVYFPRLSRSGKQQFTNYLSGALAVLLVLTVPAAVGLALVSRDLIGVLFGEAFLPAAGVLAVLAPLVLIRGCGDLLCYQAIISSGQEKRLIGARIWAGLANMVLNVLLIPKLGAVGAALASLASETVVNGILLPHGLRLGKPWVGRKLLLRIAAATAAMTVSVLCVQRWIDSSILSLALSVTLGMGAYTVILGYRKTKKELENYHGAE